MCSAASNDRLFREELNILYDSKCNVCKLEIDFLRRRDQRLNGSGSRLKFTDLESNDYDDQDPANGRIDYETGMQAMHGITPDGKVVIGVPVFQLAYQQVGLGWLLAVTEVPGLKWIFDRGYDIFAAYRTRVTRGQTVPALVEAYREKQQLLKEQSECETCNEKASTKTVS
jgi:predicted DCC family thiol-disulfide oxidoreductase YuxK